MKLSTYRNNFDFIKSLLIRDKDTGIHANVSQISLATMVPVLVVYHYAREVLGDSQEIQDGIASAMKFYGETEITE